MVDAEIPETDNTKNKTLTDHRQGFVF